MTAASIELRRILALRPFNAWTQADGVVLWWPAHVREHSYPIVGSQSTLRSLCITWDEEPNTWRWSVIPPVWRRMPGHDAEEGGRASLS